MPRRCSICDRPDLDALNAAFISGGSFRSISKRFGVSASALFRHRDHIASLLTAAEDGHGRTLLERINALALDARRIASKAESAGDLKTALVGVRELVRIVELTAKLTGELQPAPTMIAIANLPPTPDEVRNWARLALEDVEQKSRDGSSLVLPVERGETVE